MRIYILIVFWCLSVGFVQAQNRAQERSLSVGFSSMIGIDLNLDFKAQVSDQIPEFFEVLDRYDATLEAALPMDQATFDFFIKRIEAKKGSVESLLQLTRVGKVVVDPDKVDRLEEELRLFPFVNYIGFDYINPITPPYDILPTTPLYESQQLYLFDDPGVNMDYAWSLGFNGQGVRIRDVEYGYNGNHEELHQKNNFLEPNKSLPLWVTPEYSEHGTATVGVIQADKGAYGVSGMAYGVEEVVLFAEGTNEDGLNRNAAVLRAIEASVSGDIILYEMQTYGVGASDDDPKYVPAEFDYTLWHLTKMATEQGIIVVAAAGNGGQDLDAPEYASYKSRGDSGAILVGAGSPNRAHERLDFSTYGSLVKVQGWGRNVLTTGYGSYAQVGGDFNQNYVQFSGTSSATPIVASVIAVLQSASVALNGAFLSKEEVLNLIVDTGYPQGGIMGGSIGPLPNMQAALSSLVENLSLEHARGADQQAFLVYPNPTAGRVYIDMGSNSGSFELYSTWGKTLASGVFTAAFELDLATFSSGMYHLKVVTDQGISYSKIIKN